MEVVISSLHENSSASSLNPKRNGILYIFNNWDFFFIFFALPILLLLIPAPLKRYPSAIPMKSQIIPLMHSRSTVENGSRKSRTCSASLPSPFACREIDNLFAKGVVRLPLNPTSAYLKTGTFLVAHPLLTGCFAKSVICILQHTESRPTGEEEDGEHMGGTYGLVVNKPLKVGVPNHDSNQSRDRALREVIRYDCLPEGIRLAFGDNAVRNGGPVNMSIQMIRTSTTDEEEKWKVGGTVLSMVGDGSSVEDAKDEVTSTAMDTDSAIYFGGDIIKAAQAVIDNGIQEENFSFIVGASCWEPGQLEGEIEKGYWIPCSGPPDIAFSGSCVVKGAENMSVADSSLWVSMMASLGEQEGRMAQIIDDFEYDENGLPCDEF